MHSPTAALLWDIWRRKRGFAAAIASLTAISWFAGTGSTDAAGHREPEVLDQLLGLLSFLLLFAMFSYTESGDGGTTGRFPHRLFTLPVSSLRLVAVPVVTGTLAIELLYLLWMDRLSRSEPGGMMLTAILLAAFMVLSQTALWTLSRLGPVRLVVLGVIAFVLFTVGLLPSFPPTPAPRWRSEAALTAVVAVLIAAAFVIAWNHVARLRSGGGQGKDIAAEVRARMAAAMPRHRRRPFSSPDAAHFWFEWRSAGMALPWLVIGALAIIAPLSWLTRAAPEPTVQLLVVTLTAPIALAFPVGMAFSRPNPWSDDLSLPPFVVVRPLSATRLIATKVRVAALSVVVSWLVVLLFSSVWLSTWANTAAVDWLTRRLWTMHNHSSVAVIGSTALAVVGGMLLTWRFMVSRLRSGMSGRSGPFVYSALAVAGVVIAAVAFETGWVIEWLLEAPARLTAVIWGAAGLVAAKYALTVYGWRGITPPFVRQYLVLWAAGTTCFVALAMRLGSAVHTAWPSIADQVQILLLLLALLAMPSARLGLAPAALSRNRHR